MQTSRPATPQVPSSRVRTLDRATRQHRDQLPNEVVVENLLWLPVGVANLALVGAYRQATKGWFHDDEQESGSEAVQRVEQ
jgi:hypothetical protein